MIDLLPVAFLGALPFIILSIFLVGDVYEMRRQLTREIEDHAATRAYYKKSLQNFDQLADTTARIVAANEALRDRFAETCVIVPPPGGLVA